jgi:hypothetical protein
MTVEAAFWKYWIHLNSGWKFPREMQVPDNRKLLPKKGLCEGRGTRGSLISYSEGWIEGKTVRSDTKAVTEGDPR